MFSVNEESCLTWANGNVLGSDLWRQKTLFIHSTLTTRLELCCWSVSICPGLNENRAGWPTSPILSTRESKLWIEGCSFLCVDYSNDKVLSRAMAGGESPILWILQCKALIARAHQIPKADMPRYGASDLAETLMRVLGWPSEGYPRVRARFTEVVLPSSLAA